MKTRSLQLSCRGRLQTSRQGPAEGLEDRLEGPGMGKKLVADQVVVEKGVVRDHVRGRIPLQWGYLSLERLLDRLRSLTEVVVVEVVFRNSRCSIV